jgi:hypothetical protein
VGETQKKYSIDVQTASKWFDYVLIEETGSSGFIGYMKLRAEEGDNYSNYAILNSVPVYNFDLVLRSYWAWIYWILEALIISTPIIYTGYEVGTRAFNKSAKDWYNPLPDQICAVSLENKEKLIALINKENLQGIEELAIDEDNISHPMIEIYEQRSRNKTGDILLSIKQTYLDGNSNIKRNIIGKWEISQQEYLPLANAIDSLSKT